jgi:ribosome recycling factor
MSDDSMIEYRIPIRLEQDERVQDLARRLAKERGERRIPIRQIVREALDAFLAIHLSTDG